MTRLVGALGTCAGRPNISLVSLRSFEQGFRSGDISIKVFFIGFSARVVQAACKLGKCARLEEAEASIGVYRCLRSVCWEALLSPLPPPHPPRPELGFVSH